ncbi:MAG: hypothetical protein JJ885_12520 [Muricauda sp.]|jgi:hypothetical protein|nr:hypothetical protein [Allomuricauda sp.]MBO6532480.1 hypothetical protein [Allomuricauda sp.]MBO6589342.1 hypothetical protein [Allomuricauda sp.]MBO6619226.1 hypothetical protein [Allomuricauda sp.]MBO6644879.1 hypothetical protein [Allomuricauda sp.]MBO6747346.1 hypothetical protein [Allomuricauda sp.]
MNTSVKPPVWFWVVSVIALLWNLLGVMNYLNQAFNQVALMEAMNQAQREVFEGIPAWATAAFAIAVFSGTLASIGLLVRKKWARPLFIVSLVAVIIQFAHWLFISNAVEAFGPSTYGMPIVVVLIGIYLIFFAKKGIEKGWLK